ncbi:S8 family serine peptidase [Clostridium rectalis]|uniref:S8 family serine peptidase n=1 Tax=Clostridium rectalis TaxID=2040295 RepID=UPI000F64468C|nr:S8 family serine peptidase [Clostridium rectalis]
MFGFKTRISADLKKIVHNKYYKHIRVLISCKILQEKIKSKIKGNGGEVIYCIDSISCICAIVSPKIIERLLELPSIDYIELDDFAFLCNDNTDGMGVLRSNKIMYQERYKLTGKGIGIGIVDSGVYPHPDLIHPHSKIKKFLDLINDYKYPYDDNGHGTFICGLICGNGYCSKGIYKGIAENASIFAIKAFNNIGRGFISDILFAIDILTNEQEDFNLKVICLPFELTTNNSFILSLFNKLFSIAINKGMVIIVPSGHNGNSECSMQGIATLNTCITVGGLDTTSSIIKPYPNSSSGPINKVEKPDLSAACVNIYSLNSNTNYISQKNGVKLYPRPLNTPYTCYTGTSCAAAYISGVCSLLYENNPNLTFTDILSLFKISCEMLDISKWVQGRGMIDLNKLLP